MTRQLLKLLLVCPVLLLTDNTCFAQFSDGKNPEWAALNGKADSIIINGFAVIKKDTGQIRQHKYKIGLAYNGNGKLTHQDMYSTSAKQQPGNPDRIQMRISNNYDDSGRLNGMMFYNGYGNIAREVYTFKSDTLLIEAKRYGIPGNVLFETTQIQLDKAGNIVDRSTYDNSAKLLAKFTYKYNDRGQRVEATEFGLSITPNTRKWVATYSADGNLIKEVYYAGPGAVVANGTTTYTYTKFDDKHNWLVKNCFSDGKLVGVTERLITYYK